MPTTLQKQVFKKVNQKVKSNKPVVLKDIILESGGSLSTANRPQSITESKGWEELKKRYIDDEMLLMGINELASATNEDKDNRLKAIDIGLKLGDKYPKGETKIIGIFNKIEQISE